jgi:hypothetical protein
MNQNDTRPLCHLEDSPRSWCPLWFFHEAFEQKFCLFTSILTRAEHISSTRQYSELTALRVLNIDYEM